MVLTFRVIFLVRDTSLLAYVELLPELSARQVIVFDAIRNQPYSTAKELQRFLGFWDANMIRPRITELWQAGLIVPAFKRECRVTGKRVLTWKVKSYD